MAEYLFIAQLDVPADNEAEFNRLYDVEHVPNLLSVPGVSNARRYKLEDGDYGDTPRYLALYDIESPEIPSSDEWTQKASTPGWLVVRDKCTVRKRGTFRRLG